MNSFMYNLFISFLLCIGPILVLKYQDSKIRLSWVAIWEVIAFLSSIGILFLMKIPLEWIALLESIIAGTFINYGITKEYIAVKKMPKSALVIALFFFSSLFQLIPIFIFNISLQNASTFTNTALTLFSDIILLLIIVGIYFQEIKEHWIDFKKNCYQYLDTGFKYWFIGLIVMMVSNLIINFFIPGAEAGNENSVQEVIKAAPWLSLICVGILAPIIEEFTFRKAFKDFLPNKWWFIFISSIVFGGLHVILSLSSPLDLFYLIPYCSLGFSFAFMYTKTNNIFTSVSLHMFHNTVLTLLSIVSAMVIL